MHSTNVRQIKAALVEQAFLGSTRVSCPIGPVVAISKWKGQLRVMVRGWSRWYPVVVNDPKGEQVLPSNRNSCPQS